MGPGDYEIDNSKHVTTKNTVGVVTWKKPLQKPRTAAVVEATKKTELPGPGQYEVAQGLVVNSRKPQMVFASKVSRSDSLNHRNKSLSNAVKGVKSAYAIM